MSLALTVYVALRRRGPSLKSMFKEVAKLRPEAEVSVHIAPAKTTPHDQTYHEVVLHSECDLGIEYLEKIHELLSKNPKIVLYEVTRMSHSFYIHHNHANL